MNLIILTQYDPFYLAVIEELVLESTKDQKRVVILDVTSLSPTITSVYNQKILQFFGYSFSLNSIENHFGHLGAIYRKAKNNYQSNVVIEGSVLAEIDESVISALATVYRHHDPLAEIKRARVLSKKLLAEGEKVFSLVSELLNNHPRISTIYIPNGRFPAQKAAELAGQTNKKTIKYYERGLLKGTYYLQSFKPQSLFEPQEAAIKLSKTMKSQEIIDIASIWLNERSNAATGANEFALHWNENSNSKLTSILPKKIASIFTSSQDEFLNLGPEWQKHKWKSQVEAIDFAVSHLTKIGYEVYLRVHPNLANKSRKFFLSEKIQIEAIGKKYPNLNIFWHDDPVNSYELLAKTDLCIVWDSTIGLEASAMGIPTWTLALSRYGLVADIRQALEPETFESDIQEWKVDPIGAMKFITYLIKRDLKLSVDPNMFVNWNLDREPFIVQLAKALCTGGAPNTLEAVRATLDPYRNRSMMVNFTYIKKRIKQILHK